MASDWHCVDRLTPPRKNALPTCEALRHPLEQVVVKMVESKGTRRMNTNNSSNTSSRSSSIIALDPLSAAFDGIDPLSQFIRESENADPLSLMAAETPTNHKQSKEAPVEDSWSSKRAGILAKFTTTERLSIVTTFLSGGETIKSQTTATMADKVKHRLQQLDDFDETYRMLDVTQQEYIQKIEQLNQELVHAWNSDQRVTALKIVIQCSKLLADTSVLQFYPSQFVLITDVLDIFGRLVYDRLKQKSGYVRPGTNIQTSLPDNFTPDMVPEAAKETCQNWFYKIASIRELLPRFYVEVAIMKCYNFLTQNEFDVALRRLTGICRGIGDPLVAIYARCYLCRVGLTVSSDQQYLVENLNDILMIYHTQFNNGIRMEINRQRLDINAYLNLYTPALNWIMQCVANRAQRSLLDNIFDKCIEKNNNVLLLHSMLSSFKSDFISSRTIDFLKAITNGKVIEDVTKFQLMRLLGQSVVERPPAPEERFVILDEALKFITTLKSPADYVANIEMWAQYSAKYFKLKQINFILNDLLSHMMPNRSFENHYPELQSIIEKIVNDINDFEGLITMDNFLPVIDMFQKESAKVEVCKCILKAYKLKVESTTNDPVLINTLMFLCKIMNDSVNTLTVEDERRQISTLVSHFIKQVDYGHDFEAQLSFYVEARAAFLNLDAVYSILVHCVNKLAFQTRQILKRERHTKKSQAFVKACSAYCFITIPSISSVSNRMDLYYLSGGVALMNHCLGQADACFEAAIDLIQELPPRIEVDCVSRSSEPFLQGFVTRLLSLLIVVPDSPDKGVFHLPTLLFEQLKCYPFDKNSGCLTTIYLRFLDMLSTASKFTYPYHIPGVVSNDQLYGSDPKFINVVENMCNQIVEEILEALKYFGVHNQNRMQSNFALELFERIVNGSDLNYDTQFTLALNLWSLSLKNKSSLSDPKLPNRIVAHLESQLSESTIVVPKVVDLINRIKRKL